MDSNHASTHPSSFHHNWLEWSNSTKSSEVLYCAGRPALASEAAGVVNLSVPFHAFPFRNAMPLKRLQVETLPTQTISCAAFGDDVLRVSMGDTADLVTSPMFDLDQTMSPVPLSVVPDGDYTECIDLHGQKRLRFSRVDPPLQRWSELIDPPEHRFNVSVCLGNIEIPFMAWDYFSPGELNSCPLGYIEEDGYLRRITFSLHANPQECFVGTGERFAKMDLSGKTIDLKNADALGVNNRRAYKNVPFYISSRGYGLLIATSAHVKLSFADISTRAVQGMVDHGALDLFFIGGGSIESILKNYRMLTGFPQEVPSWSYGTWMGRMTYTSKEEVREVTTRMRDEKIPCDVIHLDTGWFEKDWVCDWTFDSTRFANPQQFLNDLRKNGYRVSLWQLPKVAINTRHFQEASAKGYLPKKNCETTIHSGSNLGEQEYAAEIDLTNPEAIAWYKSQLESILRLGASVVKADFGEEIDMDASYYDELPASLHNLYALLYQRAVYEITKEVTAEGLIWARSGWVGSQRYPVHWGGDSACTWDGMAASIRGGLHLGLSGFGFWSHDVAGFYGIPNFMNSWPSDILYLRWTQAAIFSSHLRFHGAQPREPYLYPKILDLVRQWLRLRYALIPYLVQQGSLSCQSGYPVMRAMIIHHQEDQTCWHIDDQFFCGDNLLIAPLMNDTGERDIYLPEGGWVDFWSGERFQGPRWYRGLTCGLSRIPVFARDGSSISVYPYAVACVDEIDWKMVAEISFDHTYQGIADSVLGDGSSCDLRL